MKDSYKIISSIRDDLRPIKDILETMEYQYKYDKEFNESGSKLECIYEGSKIIKNLIILLADK